MPGKNRSAYEVARNAAEPLKLCWKPPPTLVTMKPTVICSITTVGSVETHVTFTSQPSPAKPAGFDPSMNDVEALQIGGGSLSALVALPQSVRKRKTVRDGIAIPPRFGGVPASDTI